MGKSCDCILVEVENETTGYFIDCFNYPADGLCCATASTSAYAATAPAGTGTHTATGTPPPLSGVGPISNPPTTNDSAQGIS